MTHSLFDLELLRRRSRAVSARAIAQATGLSPDWVHKFRSGRIKNPGMNTLAVLAHFLEGGDMATASALVSQLEKQRFRQRVLRWLEEDSDGACREQWDAVLAALAFRSVSGGLLP